MVQRIVDDIRAYILDNGITMYFWNHPSKYIFVDGWHYWVMRDSEDNPTTIINRCNLEEYKLSITWKGSGKYGDKWMIYE